MLKKQDTLMTKFDVQGHINTNYKLNKLPQKQERIRQKIADKYNTPDSILMACKPNRSYQIVTTLEEGNFVYYVNVYSGANRAYKIFDTFEKAYKCFLTFTNVLPICVNRIYNIDKNMNLVEYGDSVKVDNRTMTVMSVNNGGILQVTDNNRLYNVLCSNVEKLTRFQPVGA